MEEEDQLKFGFDLLDPTKIVPEEYVPITWLGKFQLNRNPLDYFSETEQVMFQPGHVVRGIDFTDDPLLQGRLFSYLDTQLNRHNGPNFEQLPINRPRIPFHNNNRDGAGQMYIPLNKFPYTPNTKNAGAPYQATRTEGRGFFSAPRRHYSGSLVRDVSPTFDDHWSQPRLFFNSLVPQEKQFVLDAIRFETSKVMSKVVRQNVVTQLNRIDNDLAKGVARVIGIEEPEPDPTFYHDNTTVNMGTFGQPLSRVDGLKIGILTTVNTPESIALAAGDIKNAFMTQKVTTVVVAETMVDGVDQTYSASDATNFDALIVADGAEPLFTLDSFVQTTPAPYPAGRPLQILLDSFKFGHAVGSWGTGSGALKTASIAPERTGVFVSPEASPEWTASVLEGLRTLKFLDRFAVEI